MICSGLWVQESSLSQELNVTSLLFPQIFLSFYVFSICIFFVKIFIYLFLIRTYQSGIKLKRYQKAQMEKESSYADPCPSPSLEAASVPISCSLL